MKWSEVAQSCPTLCDPMYCSLSRSSIHGIFQARGVLEWVAISFSRGSSQPRDWPRVSRIASRHFYRLSHQEKLSLVYTLIIANLSQKKSVFKDVISLALLACTKVDILPQTLIEKTIQTRKQYKSGWNFSGWYSNCFSQLFLNYLLK